MLVNDPKIHHRHSTRMSGYDYSLEGAYFVTIGTYQHTCLFGGVINENMRVNIYGNIALEQWNRLRNRFYPIEFPSFVVMPNHVHGIIQIIRGAGEGYGEDVSGIPPQQIEKASRRGRWGEFGQASSGIPTQRPYNGEDIVPNGDEDVIPRSLGIIVRAYKSAVTYRINAIRGVTKPSVWQRNYYEHIIRNEKEYQQIKDYIEANPPTWADDRFYAPEITK